MLSILNKLENNAIHCTGASIFIKDIKYALSQFLQQNPFLVCEYKEEVAK